MLENDRIMNFSDGSQQKEPENKQICKQKRIREQKETLKTHFPSRLHFKTECPHFCALSTDNLIQEIVINMSLVDMT